MIYTINFDRNKGIQQIMLRDVIFGKTPAAHRRIRIIRLKNQPADTNV